MLINILVILLGYLLGSVATSIVLCRLFALPDPRTVGSNNAGATNVIRFGGHKLAIAVLVGDVLKGYVAVVVAQYLQLPAVIIMLTGFAAFLGHLYPIYFQFKGGKGVATALGVCLALSGLLAALAVLTFALVVFVSRYVALASIVTAALVPFYAFGLLDETSYWVVLAVMAVMLIMAHRSNIQRLRQGTEDKIGES